MRSASMPSPVSRRRERDDHRLVPSCAACRVWRRVRQSDMRLVRVLEIHRSAHRVMSLGFTDFLTPRRRSSSVACATSLVRFTCSTEATKSLTEHAGGWGCRREAGAPVHSGRGFTDAWAGYPCPCRAKSNILALTSSWLPPSATTSCPSRNGGQAPQESLVARYQHCDAASDLSARSSGGSSPTSLRSPIRPTTPSDKSQRCDSCKPRRLRFGGRRCGRRLTWS